MINYTIQQIAQIIQAKPFISEAKSIVKEVLIDSRKLSDAKYSLFICFKSQRNNGHNYIFQLYEKGVRNFIISEHIETELYPNANFLRVENTLQALQTLAVWHRQKFNIPVIGITGSNGKTIVKEWLAQILDFNKKTVKSPASYNSQIGVALSVLQIENIHEIAVFEAGISTKNEMDNLSRMIMPEIVIFTNLGDAHNEGFESVYEKLNEKLKLAKNAKTIIFNSAYTDLTDEIQEKKFSWGYKSEDNVQIKSIQKDLQGTSIQAIFQDKLIEIRIPFTDDASIENACHCWACLLLLNFDNAFIQDKIQALQHISMRLEIVEGIYNSIIVNDVYNCDIHSLKTALSFLEQQKLHDKKIVFLTDIVESNADKLYLYELVNEELNHRKIDTLIIIGSEIKSFKNVFQKNIHSLYAFENVKELIEKFDFSIIQSSSILLKGARKYHLEQLIPILQRKTHKTRLEINLNNVIHNLKIFQSLILPKTKLMCMVKAASYGASNTEIARLLETQNVDYLAVAYVDEAVDLRNANVKLPIMVMNPEEDSFIKIFKYNVEPEIYSFRILEKLVSDYKRAGISNQRINIHLKLDTGMHRLGFSENEIQSLCEKLKTYYECIVVKSIFTHLAASDETLYDDFTNEQTLLFNRMSDTIIQSLGYMPIRHVLNTAGIVRHSEYQYEMVRLGLGLYGFDSSKILQDKLQPIGTFISIISQVKILKSGDSVSYNRSGKVKNNTVIATIPIGYADGLPRNAGNGKWKVWIDGQLAPTIGNICMDMTMIDITGLNDIYEGTEVEIFGQHLSVDDLAKVCDTISYEILTRISYRVKRIFYQE
jgi:alanine racemase